MTNTHEQHRHILYYSPSHIRQLFFDRIDESSKVTKESEKRSSLRSSLRIFISDISGKQETRENIMKTVNHSEEHIQTKKLVNELLDDDSIPRVRDFSLNKDSSLYRFSCECQLLSVDGGPEDKDFIEVIGREGDFEFGGHTSLENWSSLSDTLYAMQNKIPYPFDGLVQIKDIQDQVIREGFDGEKHLERANLAVNFIFICQSDRREVKRWMNRKNLIDEYYSRKEVQGDENG